MVARASRKLKRGMPFHPDEVRRKIRATELVNRLQSHIFDGLELTLSQVNAISILLRKCVPDLTSTAVVADITHRYVVELPPMLSIKEWETKYGIDHLNPQRIIDGTTNGNGGNGKETTGTTPDKILQ
jgi:hypothetical protein